MSQASATQRCDLERHRPTRRRSEVNSLCCRRKWNMSARGWTPEWETLTLMVAQNTQRCAGPMLGPAAVLHPCMALGGCVSLRSVGWRRLNGDSKQQASTWNHTDRSSHVNTLHCVQRFRGEQGSAPTGRTVKHVLDHPHLDLDTATTYNDSFQGEQPLRQLPLCNAKACKEVVPKPKHDATHVALADQLAPSSLTRYPNHANPHKCALRSNVRS